MLGLALKMRISIVETAITKTIKTNENPHTCITQKLLILCGVNTILKYPKRSCIIRRNLPLKRLSGMWVRIIYYDRFWETFYQDVGCDRTDISKDVVNVRSFTVDNLQKP